MRAPYEILPELLKSERGRVTLAVGAFVLYVVTARFGLSIHPVNNFATFIWPPSGIALALLLLGGYRFWPVIAVGAFLVNVSIGASIPVALVIALGNTLEAIVGAHLLQSYVRFSSGIVRLRDSAGIILTAFSVSAIAATFGFLALEIGGSVAPGTGAATWLAWWTGDALGMLVIAPFLIKWLTPPFYERTVRHYIELGLSLLAVAGACLFPVLLSPPRYAYLVFIPMGWVALRTGLRGTTLAFVLVMGIEVSLALLGEGPFIDSQDKLLALQVFLMVLAAFFLVFASIVEELRRTRNSLEENIGALEASLVKVSSADEAKSEFLAILAHELRNPLAAMLSSVELLKMDGIEGEEKLKLLDTVDSRVRSMAGLLEDLLDISRISQRRLKLDMRTVPLGHIISQMEQTFSGVMREHGLAFTVKTPNTELHVVGDPVRLEQIVGNLLSNAAKYTEKGYVELSVQKERGYAEISVKDSGIGIPKGMVSHIFKPFFQIDRGRRTNHGLGIGLSLTRQLVEMHGGTIAVESKGEGMGATFTVTLPLTEAEENATDRKTLSGTRALRRTTNAKRILVVDDNEPFADGMSQLLTMRGHTLAIANTGKEALRKATEFQPEIVLLDIGLPDIDGYEVARRLREKHPRLVLLALSGYGQRDDKEKALKAGFDRHLTKPAGLREVEAALRSIK